MLGGGFNLGPNSKIKGKCLKNSYGVSHMKPLPFIPKMAKPKFLEPAKKQLHGLYLFKRLTRSFLLFFMAKSLTVIFM